MPQKELLKRSVTVDKAIKALGLTVNTNTDPRVIRSVLKEMKLHDLKTNFKPIKKFFNKASIKPQNLAPLLKNIKQGLISKHPAVIEFLDKALTENWLEKSKNIQRSVHVAFVLEAITAGMVNNNKFLIEIQDHLLNKRRKYGIKTDSALGTFWKVWRITRSIFGALKTISIDSAITYYRFRRILRGIPLSKMYIKRLYKQGDITYTEYKLFLSDYQKDIKGLYHLALNINIYEAAITEYIKSFKDNALCAYILVEESRNDPNVQQFKVGTILPENATSTFYKSLAHGNNFFPTTALNQEWISLYETWNMAFILSEFDDLHILFPKLLIPSVVDSKSENYMAVRIIALWLSINTIMFKKLENKKEIKGPSNKREMAKAWGKINKEHARALPK